MINKISKCENKNFNYFVKSVYPIDSFGNLINNLNLDKTLFCNINKIEKIKDKKVTLFQIMDCFINLEIILLIGNFMIKNISNANKDKIIWIKENEWDEYEIMPYKKEIMYYEIIYIEDYAIFKSILGKKIVKKGFWNDGTDCNIKMINNEDKIYINIIKSIFESSNNYDIYGYLINFVKTNKISDSISLGIIVSKLVSYLSLNIEVAQDGNVFNWIEPSCNNKFNKIKNLKNKEWIVFDNKGKISINNFNYNHTGFFKEVKML